MPCWQMRLGFARPSLARLACGRAMLTASSPYIARRKHSRNSQREPLGPNPNNTLGRAIATKRVVQTADITIERPYLQGDPLAVAAVELGGYRTVLAVPMLKESEIIA